MAVLSPRTHRGGGKSEHHALARGGGSPSLYLSGTNLGLVVGGGERGCREEGDGGQRDLSCLWWGKQTWSQRGLGAGGQGGEEQGGSWGDNDKRRGFSDGVRRSAEQGSSGDRDSTSVTPHLQLGKLRHKRRRAAAWQRCPRPRHPLGRTQW